jgi:selenocysteine lyase/cysteine desulfurase
MASIRLAVQLDDEGANRITAALADEDRIEVPIVPFPVPAAREAGGAPPSTTLLRISAQRYNEPADYERLAEVLERRGLAGATTASAIVAG